MSNIIRTLRISDTTRYVIRKYTDEAYQTQASGDNQGMRHFTTYHDADDMTQRGLSAGRQRYLDDMQETAGQISDEEGAIAIAYFTGKVTYDSLDLSEEGMRVIHGLSHLPEDCIATDDPTDSRHYARAWYYSGMHSKKGLLLGRLVATGNVITSRHRDAFFPVKLASEDFSTCQQGSLYLRMPSGESDPSAVPVDWRLTINDGWTFGGIHGSNPFYLCTEPIKDNIWKEENKVLRVMGRESAIIMGSGAYEMHMSRGFGHELGDADLGLSVKFVPIGAPKEVYRWQDGIESVRRHIEEEP